MFLRNLGKRGAEMVEYAIVLACIAAVGVGFYSSNDSKLTGVLDGLFGKVTAVVDLALGNTSNTKINRAPLKPGDYPEGLQDAVNAAVDGIYDAYKESGYNLRTLKIDNKGKLTEITYWTGDETFATLDSTKYLTSNCNSYLDGTGFQFDKDKSTGNDSLTFFLIKMVIYSCHLVIINSKLLLSFGRVLFFPKITSVIVLQLEHGELTMTMLLVKIMKNHILV